MAAWEGHLEVVRLLVESGAKIDQGKTDDGATPLFIAAQQGDLEVVRLLVQSGAKKDQGKTDTGATALSMAACNGHLEVVRLLVESGAKKDQGKTDTGATPLEFDSKMNRRKCKQNEQMLLGAALSFPVSIVLSILECPPPKSNEIKGLLYAYDLFSMKCSQPVSLALELPSRPPIQTLWIWQVAQRKRRKLQLRPLVAGGGTWRGIQAQILEAKIRFSDVKHVWRWGKPKKFSRNRVWWGSPVQLRSYTVARFANVRDFKQKEMPDFIDISRHLWFTMANILKAHGLH